MNLRRSDLLLIFLLLLGLLSVFLLFRVNYSFVVHNPGGEDFLIRWLGTRLWVMEGQSPYSVQTVQAIQKAASNALIQQQKDQLVFLDPLYSTLVYFPLSLIPNFEIARAIWMTFLEICLLLILACSIVLSQWQIRPVMLAFLMAFTVLWFYSMRILLNSFTSLNIVLLISIALLAIRNEQDGLAGFLLAITTTRPMMVALLILFILLWSFSRRRWALIWSLVGSTILLSAATSLLIPNWLWQYTVQIYRFLQDYTAYTSRMILSTWLPGIGNQLGWGLIVVLSALLIWEWWRAWSKDYEWFLWTALLTLAISQLVGLPIATENYMIMFPGLVLVFSAWDEQWRKFGRVLIYLCMMLLFFGIWWIDLSAAGSFFVLNQSLALFPLLPTFIIVCLYWVRWWVIMPKEPLLDRIRRRQYFRQTSP